MIGINFTTSELLNKKGEFEFVKYDNKFYSADYIKTGERVMLMFSPDKEEVLETFKRVMGFDLSE